MEEETTDRFLYFPSPTGIKNKSIDICKKLKRLYKKKRRNKNGEIKKVTKRV